VADSRSYALLDVDRQLKIPLFPISSLDESQSGSIGGRAEDISGHTGTRVQRSTSSAQPSHASLLPEDRGHSRSTSLGTLISGVSRLQGQRSGSRDRALDAQGSLLRESSPATARSPVRSVKQEVRPRKDSSASDKPLPAPPSVASTAEQRVSSPAVPLVYLKPHIVSPTPQEFLLVTGTGAADPGVGLFVNLEGDVTRSTLEFDHYPTNVIVDGRGVGTELSPVNAEEDEEGYVLATMGREPDKGIQYGIEVQRWDLDPGEGEVRKSWLQVPSALQSNEIQENKIPRLGIRSVLQAGEGNFEDVVEKLRLRRFNPFATQSTGASSLSLHSADSRTATSLERVSKEKELFDSQEIQDENSMPEGWEEARDEEEYHFAKRLGQSRSHITVWSRDKIWWAVRNPLILQLDAKLEPSEIDVQEPNRSVDDSKRILEIVNSLRGREAKTEIEYMSFGYIRQHAGLLLFINILGSSSPRTEIESRVAEEALLEGGLDPRVILTLVPLLRSEVVGGKSGIWIHGGLKETAEDFISAREAAITAEDKQQPIAEHALQFLKRFLLAWRRKKGFGSIADENEVFRSVDASLLVVLLELDKSSPRGPARGGSVRAELNELVDHGLDCFERAVTILESYHRLFVLSRLYQSRKMANEVLATWRRIVEGEGDNGGEFSDGEQKVREYLTNVRNPAAVHEYGVWLATRNPRLGVQVFAEDKSKVKFKPTEVVEILRQGAPDAVKEYLEYLVFGKNHTEYVNELIAYYMDVVIHKLETSEEARAILAQTYESYRALRAPKPTYRQFITENALQEEWWHSRLRLLQLLGGSHGSASEYDVEAILARVAPFTQELVPEVIILDGRQSHHEEALKLLTQGLGDYDTAINYCLLGGSSIYHPVSGSRARETLPSREEQSVLFRFLLAEFLNIKDISDRVEQTANLLERFGGWFDVGYVLGLIPDTWSVELVSSFLVSALRRIVKEKNETTVAKALSGAENLKISADLIGKIGKKGPTIEAQN
jgi:hypothetical protein